MTQTAFYYVPTEKRDRFNQIPLSTDPSLIVAIGSTSLLSANLLNGFLEGKKGFGNLPYEIINFDTADPEYLDLNVTYNRLVVKGEQAIKIKDKPLLYPRYKVQDVFIDGNIPETDATGAGAVRNNGNAAALVNTTFEEVAKAIFGRLLAMDSNTGIPQNKKTLNIVFVIYAGGGTGSGACISLADKIRVLANSFGISARITFHIMLPLMQASNRAQANTQVLAMEMAAEHLELKEHEGKFHINGNGNNNGNGITPNFMTLTAFQRIGQVYLYGINNDNGFFRSERQLCQSVADAIALMVMNKSGIGKKMRDDQPDLHDLQGNDAYGLPTNNSTITVVSLYTPLDIYIEMATRRNFAKIVSGFCSPQPAAGKNDNNEDVLGKGNALDALDDQLDADAAPKHKRDWLADILGAALGQNYQAGAEDMISTISQKYVADKFEPLRATSLSDRAWTEANLQSKESEKAKQIVQAIAKVAEEAKRDKIALVQSVRQVIQDGLDGGSLQGGILYSLQEELRQVNGQLKAVLGQTGFSAEGDSTVNGNIRKGACPTAVWPWQRKMVEAARNKYCKHFNDVYRVRLETAARNRTRELLNALERVIEGRIRELETRLQELQVQKQQNLEWVTSRPEFHGASNEHPLKFPVLSTSSAVNQLLEEISGYSGIGDLVAARLFIKHLQQNNRLSLLLEGKASVTGFIPTLLEDYLYDYCKEQVSEVVKKGDYTAARLFYNTTNASSNAERQAVLSKMMTRVKETLDINTLITGGLRTQIYIGFKAELPALRDQVEKDFGQALSNQVGVKFLNSVDPSQIDIAILKHGFSFKAVKEFTQGGRFYMAYTNEASKVEYNAAKPLYRSSNAEQEVKNRKIVEALGQ